MMSPGSRKMNESDVSKSTVSRRMNDSDLSKSTASSDPSKSNSSTSWDAVSAEGRLEEFCQKGLSLDKETTIEVLRLFRETKHVLATIITTPGAAPPEDNEKFWFACVLYAVKRLIGGSSVSRGDQGSSNTGFTLNQILKLSNFKVTEFLNEMPQFYIKAGSILCKLYGSDWEQRLQAMELNANFNHLRLLNKYYKRAYQELFLSSDTNQDKSHPEASNGFGMTPKYFRFGWMLFLALRIHVFSRFKDMVTCTNGLVSILAILIMHIPIQFRNFSLNDSTRFERKSEKGVDLIASLCKIYHTSEEDICNILEMTNKLIVDILKKTPQPALESQAEELNDIDCEGLTYFENLMEEGALDSNIKILDEDYEDAIHDRGELDERMFVNDDDTLLSAVSVSASSATASGVKRKYEAIASPTKTITSPCVQGLPLTSPAKKGSIPDSVRMPPPTPVTETMTTAKWLRTVITPLPAEPSTELCQFLSSCDKDITQDVIYRTNVILEAIFPSSVPGGRCIAGSLHSAALMDGIWAEERRKEASKLYYRVLTSMCRAESQRLRNKNLTSLLANERFHRCMIACSAELVLATHKTVTIVFPTVLERTGITAFDLSKVIESFVRHEETLPRELKRHLNSLEEKLLESMAWEKGSTMYNSLIIAKPRLAEDINRQCLLADPMPSLDAIAMHYHLPSTVLHVSGTIKRVEPSADVSNAAPSTPQKPAPPPVMLAETGVTCPYAGFVSPVKERSVLSSISMKARLQPLLQSAFLSPTRPSPAGGGETCAETSINIFFQKVLKLAAIRIKSLSERLQTPDHIMDVIYKLMKVLLNQATHLFFNRHIDQLILCCFYGMTKVYNLKVMFKDIVDQYKKQPYYNAHVYRNVFVDWQFVKESKRTGQETVDIIRFYNLVFIPSAKQYVVALGPNKDSVKTEDTAKNDDGPSPVSPQASPFSSLPDMSPKKVSAGYNVYVSPLRSSKMEAIVAHNSKSLYACVGESTHAYQSPSKDLTAINNRLNSRRAGARLDFDNPGLVSDTIVTGSLFPNTQNAPNLTTDSALSQSQSQSQSETVPWTKSASPMKWSQKERQ